MKLDAKQKKLLLFGGAALLLLLFVYLRAQSAKAQTAPIVLPAAEQPQAQAAPVDLSPVTFLLQAIGAGITDSQQALASVTQNQVVQSKIDLASVGAASWLACLPVGGGKPDAMCIKNKGGVNIPGLPDVSGVKTGDVFNYVSPYSQCKRADGSYDLQCVGFLITGQPSLTVAQTNRAPQVIVQNAPAQRTITRQPLIQTR